MKIWGISLKKKNSLRDRISKAWRNPTIYRKKAETPASFFGSTWRTWRVHFVFFLKNVTAFFDLFNTKIRLGEYLLVLRSNRLLLHKNHGEIPGDKNPLNVSSLFTLGIERFKWK